MARTSVIFLSHPTPSQESAEVCNYAIASLFQTQKFRVISGMSQTCVENAMGLCNKFGLKGVVSGVWNPKEKNGAGLMSKEDLNRLEGWSQEATDLSWEDDDLASFHLRLLRALKSLDNDPTVICVLPEVLARCLSLLCFTPKSMQPIFVLIDSPSSVKRKILVECKTIEEIRGIPLNEIVGGLSGTISRKIAEQEEAVRRIFLNALPTGEGSGELGGINEFVEKTREGLETLNGKLDWANEEVERTAANLLQFSQENAQTLFQVNSQVQPIARRQADLERTLSTSCASSLSDIPEISKSLKSLETRLLQDKTELAGLNAMKPAKRKPLQILSVTQYPGKILAKIRSFRHYSSYACYSIVANGHAYKEGYLEIKIGEGEVIICDRAELPPGNYTLYLMNYPDKNKYLSEAATFEVTVLREQDYRESFLYSRWADVNNLERELETLAGSPMLQAFRDVVTFWADTDDSQIPNFVQAVKENAGVITPQELKAILKARGFNFVDS